MAEPGDRREQSAAAVRALLTAIEDAPGEPRRLVERVGGRACLVLVWDADGPMPTVEGERRRGEVRGRAGCRADVLDVLRRSGRPLTRKEVVTATRAAGHGHGPGTVAKALADLTAAAELLNPRDGRGYRLPGWVRPRLGLFGTG